MKLRARASYTNIRYGGKGVSMTKALAYYNTLFMTEVKRVI
jgi:hypothetical protein